MDGRPAHKASEFTPEVIHMIDTDKIKRKLEGEVDEYAIENVSANIGQLRFSGKEKDVYNEWNEENASIFASIGKREAEITVESDEDIEEAIEKLVKIIKMSPENDLYGGLNPEKQVYRIARQQAVETDIEEDARKLISGSMDSGSDRVSGLIYRRHETYDIITSYNSGSFSRYGTEYLIRTFKGSRTGQESYQSASATEYDPYDIGKESAESLNENTRIREGDEGKFDVIFSPYSFGNIMTYGSAFFSAYSVLAGLSCFTDKIGSKISRYGFNLYDDPTDEMGIGYRPIDDEGTATRKKAIISDGRLETYLHSYSTAKKFSTKTTGNAGIISPGVFQLSMDPGKTDLAGMISGMKNGLIINNSWYLRFQDERNGLFSTVPRDGIYHVVDGKIEEEWRGIRISESFPGLIMRIDDVSKERKRIKWWNEIMPSVLPFVKIGEVNISRAF